MAVFAGYARDFFYPPAFRSTPPSRSTANLNGAADRYHLAPFGLLADHGEEQMNKYDLSNQAHKEPRKFRIGKINRLLISVGGGQPDRVFEFCLPNEVADFKARGAVLLGTTAISSVTGATVLHLAFGDGGLKPLLLLAGLGIGVLQGMIDSFVQYRGSLVPQGLAELRNAGLKLPVPERAVFISYVMRIFRVIQGGTLGFLGGLVFMLAANGTDIRAYIDEKFMTDNRTVAEEAAKLVDASIMRSKDALLLETTELNNLSRSIQSLRANDVRRAISASRKTSQASSKSVGASPDVQLGALEKRLTDETAKRDILKATVDTQETNRNSVIEATVSDAPHHIPKRIGLSAQMEALSALTREDPKLLLLIFAFELISLALELGPMFCAATYVPSAYAARLALDHFEQVTTLAADGAERLGARVIEDQPAPAPIEPETEIGIDIAPFDALPPREANDNLPPTTDAMNGEQKRGRGRPRGSKTQSNATLNGADHE
jgi:hypothetical protein